MKQANFECKYVIGNIFNRITIISNKYVDLHKNGL